MRSTTKRHRDPVPPSFSLPPRGLKCQNWLKFAKRELKLRMKSLHLQRAKVIEIIINRVISIVIVDTGNDLLSFKLQCDTIIDGLINEFKSKLLDSWTGPKFRSNSNSWKTKKWEGRNGYYKLCKNYSDQNQNKIAHNFWIPIFKHLISFIHQISHQQYRNNQILQNALKNCLIYSCFYTICSSKIAFPKTRALPLFLETAMAKNGNIRQYLKEFDGNLNIYRFKEEESERYNRERRICQAVKQRCIQYIGRTVETKLTQFNEMTNLHGNINKFKLEQFEFTIEFDKNGQIGRTQQCKDEMDNNDVMDQDDAKTEAPSMSAVSTSLSVSSLPPLLPPLSSPSIPAIIASDLSYVDSAETVCTASDNINDVYLSAECHVLSYGACRGSTHRVEHSRYTPFRPHQFGLGSIGLMPSNQYQYQYAAQPIQYEEECCCNNNEIDYLYDGHLSHNVSAESGLSSVSFNSLSPHCYSLSGSSSSYIPEYNGNMNGNTSNMNQTVYTHHSYPYKLQSHIAPQYQYN